MRTRPSCPPRTKSHSSRSRAREPADRIFERKAQPVSQESVVADIDATDTESVTSYTSETPTAEYTTESSSARIATIAPAGATGRRKEAVARVRLTPGTGEWSINGRPLEEYSRNKVHQQLVNEPFVTLEQQG